MEGAPVAWELPVLRLPDELPAAYTWVEAEAELLAGDGDCCRPMMPLLQQPAAPEAGVRAVEPPRCLMRACFAARATRASGGSSCPGAGHGFFVATSLIFSANLVFATL